MTVPASSSKDHPILTQLFIQLHVHSTLNYAISDRTFIYPLGGLSNDPSAITAARGNLFNVKLKHLYKALMKRLT